jgi:hypothetical protein
MMIFACLVNITGATLSSCLVRGRTLGIPPVAFLMTTTPVTETLYNAFTMLPAMVLFAKLIPDSVESSMFALLTGLMNFSNLYLAQENGVFVNSFVHVD